MKALITLLLLVLCLQSNAQHSIVVSAPMGSDQVYLAGDINGWNPADGNYQLEEIDVGIFKIDLNNFKDSMLIHFKFTKGSWDEVEVDAEGFNVQDRQLYLVHGGHDKMVIPAWKQVDKQLHSTSQKNVHLLDSAMYMSSLDRSRAIWIYLPPDYEDSNKKYPLLIMQDGQNLFDASMAFSGEWNVDEHLNQMHKDGFKVPIVVGVENGQGKRGDEYLLVRDDSLEIGGEGEAYLKFIAEELVPRVQKEYRISGNRKDYGIMGSSLGGVISVYGLALYPDLFSLCAAYSPAYWVAPDVYEQDFSYDKKVKLIQIAGSNEMKNIVEDVERMEHLLKSQNKKAEVKSTLLPEGQHNEAFWSEQFSEAIRFLFNE